MREDPIEGPKLHSIDAALRDSSFGNYVDNYNAEFEAETDRDFNTNMNNEDRMIKLKARL